MIFRAQKTKQMNLGDLHKVWEVKALKKPGEEEAKKVLEKIAKQVQPIMRNHKWRVKLLSEFWYVEFFHSLFLNFILVFWSLSFALFTIHN